MASNNVTQLNQSGDAQSRHSFTDESASDRSRRKLLQAEALSATLYGDSTFLDCDRTIQGNVLWLLSDLITEAREAQEAHDAGESAKRREAREAAR